MPELHARGAELVVELLDAADHVHNVVLTARCLRPQVGGKKRHRVKRLGRSVAGHVGVGEDVDAAEGLDPALAATRVLGQPRMSAGTERHRLHFVARGECRACVQTRGRSGS